MKHKKQHYIPQGYLRAWCDPNAPKHHDPYVWLFSRDGTQAKKKSPEKIFRESDMYTMTNENGSRNLSLEIALSRLEDSFCNVRKRRVERGIMPEGADLGTIIEFVAAMTARTKTQREHQARQYGKILSHLEAIEEWARNATTSERQQAWELPSHDNEKGMSIDEVRATAEKPLQNLLVPMVEVMAPLLAILDCAILCTDKHPGFITSDSPCVWFDAEASKRPPLDQYPALIYDTIEITLPLSPRKCLLLNRKHLGGMIQLGTAIKILNEINRRTRFLCDEYFIVNANHTEESWFDPGKEPEDSWRRLHQNSGQEGKLGDPPGRWEPRGDRSERKEDP